MFENSLIASRKQERSKLMLLALPIALAIHVLALGGYVIAQMWAVPEIPEPPIQVSFYQAPPPPPPPPPPPKPAAPQPKPVVQQAAPQPVVQPIAIPDKPAMPGSGDVDDGGVEGGVEGGVAGGIPGGVPGGVVGGVPGGIVDEPPIRIGGEVVPPELINKVQPVYPEIARKARVQGVVIVEAIIDKQGNVTEGRVLRGLPMGVSEAAVAAIGRWKYKPAILNGRPVAVYLTVTVTFTLQ
ncbi:MAG TPA: TonB family protein [Thermoanaerobaculaceae bacterium]|nr:TonB family protein [Thermoanaerobaculaceae bacterium]